MKKILPPHREQDGWQYWRVRVLNRVHAKDGVKPDAGLNGLLLARPNEEGTAWECVRPRDIGIAIHYDDSATQTRVISSRRVEEAVETADFLKLCAEEGIRVVYNGDGKGRWYVGGAACSFLSIPWGTGDTLREAYYRYKSQEAS